MKGTDAVLAIAISFTLGVLTMVLIGFLFGFISYEWAEIVSRFNLVFVAVFTVCWYLLIRRLVVDSAEN